MPQCKLKNCPYSRDGRCVENQLPNCPNLLPDAVGASEGQQETVLTDTQTTPPLPQHEALYSGKKLTAVEATQIRQANPAQVVVLGGMVESGKTTLLARIFEMFQCGCVAGQRFAASRTLGDFDKLSWHATMECGAASPTTEHTYRSENNLFLHIRVRAEDGSTPPTDLLIGDIPGEIFPEAVAEESVCREICALQPANHLMLFVDGGVLCDPANRHDHCGKVIDFVSRALQTGQIGQHTILHLVVSKCDLLPKDEANEVLKYVKDTEAMFRDKFSSYFGGLHLWRLAARPAHPKEPTLREISEMFATWMTRSTVGSFPSSKAPLRSSFHRDFCRFGL